MLSLLRIRGELFRQNLCTVDASVSTLFSFHKQPVVCFALEILSPLHLPVILTNCKTRWHNVSNQGYETVGRLTRLSKFHSYPHPFSELCVADELNRSHLLVDEHTHPTRQCDIWRGAGAQSTTTTAAAEGVLGTNP